MILAEIPPSYFDQATAGENNKPVIPNQTYDYPDIGITANYYEFDPELGFLSPVKVTGANDGSVVNAGGAGKVGATWQVQWASGKYKGKVTFTFKAPNDDEGGAAIDYVAVGGYDYTGDEDI
jgi:hypothetical protein